MKNKKLIITVIGVVVICTICVVFIMRRYQKSYDDYITDRTTAEYISKDIETRKQADKSSVTVSANEDAVGYFDHYYDFSVADHIGYDETLMADCEIYDEENIAIHYGYFEAVGYPISTASTSSLKVDRLFDGLVAYVLTINNIDYYFGVDTTNKIVYVKQL